MQGEISRFSAVLANMTKRRHWGVGGRWDEGEGGIVARSGFIT